ncbi:cell division protein FtsA [Halovulum dunhuangense]|uniref:Cell division protein FtsA n=1 Tax=Halovulum dunhuangense TaxID=1505036 RepID=A0A849L156_9RHOB|nr:cell division protein FtsA [Halovulum dunhuangense]NNU80016.1 cell division protein FtsA [Halovulum dunhuangense]
MSNLFEAQRMMRQRREAALRRGVVAVLDIGTSKISCLVLRFAPGLEEEAGQPRRGLTHGAFRVIGAATTRSRGVRAGEIDAMDETERAIRTAVQAAQKMANVRVDHVIASFAGGAPRSYGLSGDVRVENGEVSELDVGHVLAACDVPDYGADREALHALPVNFTLDGRTGLIDPRGQIGARLSVDMHLLTVDAGPVHNILQCFRRCDLELAGLTVSGYAAGMSALVEDEQELGAACIDIGGGTASISIFVKRHMIYADAVPLGGHHLTSDICQGLDIPAASAERIKTLHGGVMATGLDDRELIEIPSLYEGEGGDRRQVTRSELIGVMRPRMEEILEEVRDRLDASGFEYLPGQRIVLTGGSAQVPGLDQLAARILGRQVRVGKPLRVQGLPQAATGPAFSAAVGLALHASQPQDECWDFEMPADRVGARRVRRALRWFRENW